MAESLVELMAVSATGAPDEFIGATEAYGMLGVYGGHFVGQALAAGLATVAEPKLAQSFHGYFLRPGAVDVPITYQVQRLREGKGSDVRQINAVQDGEVRFTMLASFKRAEEGDQHQPPMPQVTAPEVLAKTAKAGFGPPPTKDGRAEMLLATEPFVSEAFVAGRDAKIAMWARCPSDALLDERQAQVALAYLSDGTLMFNSVIPHGLPFRTHRLTSIDHAAWFHRPCQVTEWMLFDQHSSAAEDGRGMNHGNVFAADGSLVMTMAQESMLRRIPGAA